MSIPPKHVPFIYLYLMILQGPETIFKLENYACNVLYTSRVTTDCLVNVLCVAVFIGVERQEPTVMSEILELDDIFI